MRASRVALLLAAVAVVAPQAQAFASVQKGDAPHDEITAVAGDLGWPEDAVEALQAAVRQPDIDDLRTVKVEGGKDRTAPSVTYQPWHHCTRQPPGADADAFNATVAYVREQRGLAENLSLLDPAAAVRALGRALHALQDCFSHSNAVDLGPGVQRALADALVRGGAMPAGLRLCGVAPGDADIERPPGDSYSHADFNKDDETASPEATLLLPDGRSKYEAAHLLAANATAAFLGEFMGRLDAAETERLLSAGPDREPERGLRRMPPPPLLLLLGALAWAALLHRR